MTPSLDDHEGLEALDRISDLEEEVAYWRARAEGFRDLAVELAEEASKCLVLAYDRHVEKGREAA